MIELAEVSRVFTMGDQEVRALDHINLDIAGGEYVSVMGPSGSGKSTLLNIIGLLDQPSSGKYLLEGRDITALTETEQAKMRRSRIGFIFQAFHLIPRLTTAENIELPLVLEGLPPEQRQARVKAALEETDLADRAHHRPAELSGGQRQRVAIARATILKPAVLLADEPTGNLDHKTGAEVIALLEKLHHAGTTVIVVTHDREIGSRAHRRIQMRDGEIVEDKSA